MKFAPLLGLASLAYCSQVLNQQSLALTIYNDDFAIVKDVRNIRFHQGHSTLYFTDVSSNIQPQTVTFKALDDPHSVRVYEQNFQQNLVDEDAILKKYINKQVQIIANIGNQPTKVTGTLLSHDEKYILKTNSGVVILQSISSINLPSLPDGFFTVPTLNWKVYSQQPQQQKCEVAYRTSGFSWKSDYSLTLSEDESLGDIGGWVTIDNYSGKRYENAKLKLIAGDVNIAQGYDDNEIQGQLVAYDEAGYYDSGPEFSQKTFGDYHLYTLSEPVTLSESSQKQVEFINKVYGVSLRKYNQIVIFTGAYTEDITVTNNLRFTNTQEVGLGIPFPKGTFRVFKQDQSDDSLQFIGEDTIQHTPKDQVIQLNIGNAFDVTADIKAQSYESFDKGGYKADMVLTIRNRKNKQVEIQVNVVEYFGKKLQLIWDSSNKSELKKEHSYLYKIVSKLQGDETVVYKWKEDYRP